MAKDNQKELYKLGDVVVINKENYRITKVYPNDKRYRVMSLNPNVSFCWDDFYPSHSEITGLVGR